MSDPKSNKLSECEKRALEELYKSLDEFKETRIEKVTRTSLKCDEQESLIPLNDESSKTNNRSGHANAKKAETYVSAKKERLTPETSERFEATTINMMEKLTVLFFDLKHCAKNVNLSTVDSFVAEINTRGDLKNHLLDFMKILRDEEITATGKTIFIETHDGKLKIKRSMSLDLVKKLPDIAAEDLSSEGGSDKSTKYQKSFDNMVENKPANKNDVNEESIETATCETKNKTKSTFRTKKPVVSDADRSDMGDTRKRLERGKRQMSEQLSAGYAWGRQYNGEAPEEREKERHVSKTMPKHEKKFESDEECGSAKTEDVIHKVERYFRTQENVLQNKAADEAMQPSCSKNSEGQREHLRAKDMHNRNKPHAECDDFLSQISQGPTNGDGAERNGDPKSAKDNMSNSTSYSVVDSLFDSLGAL